MIHYDKDAEYAPMSPTAVKFDANRNKRALAAKQDEMLTEPSDY